MLLIKDGKILFPGENYQYEFIGNRTQVLKPDTTTFWIEGVNSENAQILDLTVDPLLQGLGTVINGVFSISAEKKNNAYKLDARNKIHDQVGDLDDLVADLSKRVDWLERALIRLMSHVLGTVPMSDEYKQKYLGFADTIIAMVDAGQYIPRADLYPDEAALFQELVTKQNTIASIVKTEYLDKKEN